MKMLQTQFVREYFLLNLNPIVRSLVLSDIIMRSAGGFLGPIFALFVAEFIVGGNAEVVGIAMTIYLFTKSIFQIPFATVIDRIRGEADDFWFMFIGSLTGALIPLSYLFIHTPMELYVTQFVYGISAAACFPSFMALFTRHLDKNKEGSDWGIYYTLTDFSGAIAATVGGVIAVTLGYRPLILIVVAVGVLASCFLLPVRAFVREQKKKST